MEVPVVSTGPRVTWPTASSKCAAVSQRNRSTRAVRGNASNSVPMPAVGEHNVWAGTDIANDAKRTSSFTYER